jgi:hypothetical protein
MVIGMWHCIQHLNLNLAMVRWILVYVIVNDNSLELNGIFKFKIGDDINIISNGTSSTFKILLVSEEDNKTINIEHSYLITNVYLIPIKTS